MSRRGGRRSIRHNTKCLTASKPMAPRAMASRTAAVTSSILNASIRRSTCTNSRLPCLPMRASSKRRLAEHARALPLAVTKNASHCDLGVVIQDRPRNTTKECECPRVPVAERFRRLRRKRHYKTGVRVRQVECQEVDLAFHPADDPDRFTKVRLRVTRLVRQRHEHLL